MYSLKILSDQPFRYFITATGIALCVLLMLFLMGIYKGVSDGSVEYIRSNDADIWVLQRHANNILRSTSLLKSNYGARLDNIKGVASAAPVIFVMGSAKLPHGDRTLYLAGYDPETGRGGPPEIYEGRTLESDDEIVLDRSFAEKNKIQVGDSITIKNDTLTVVGLSTKTNMIVIQYAFVTLAQTHRIIGFSGIVSCFMVKIEPGEDHEKIASEIERQIPDVAAFDRETFLQNNIMEMESGILPMLFIVALIGAVVLTAILSLILTINVLEHRKDFSVMKALGAPSAFVPRLVVMQSLLLSLSGLGLGLATFFPLIRFMGRIAPEVSVVTSVLHIASAIMGVVAISLISSIFPIQKLRKVYPLEVFK